MTGPEDELIQHLPFGPYLGPSFMDFKFRPKEFLIDNMLHRDDTCLIIGSPKSGKSLFVKQMICSLTSAHPFLEKYQVSAPCKVVYVQLEGEPCDTQDRLRRMEKKVEFRRENFGILYSGPLMLNDRFEVHQFIKDIEMMGRPDVLVIDGLYLAFSGSLSDDTVVRSLIGNLRIVKQHFNCTLVIVHHTHKVRFNSDGDVIAEGDNAVFGSQFLRAWPDHIFHLHCPHSSDVRELKCGTQRSGVIEVSIKMKLVQPDPLYFEVIDEAPIGAVTEAQKKKIMAYLDKTIIGGARASEIMNDLGIPKASFFRIAAELIADKYVYKDGSGKAALYRSLKRDEIDSILKSTVSGSQAPESQDTIS